jgi:hypothetical protein
MMVHVRLICRQGPAIVFHGISKRLVGLDASEPFAAKANEQLEIE